MLFPSSRLLVLVVSNAVILSAKPSNSAVDQPPETDHWMGNNKMREWMSQFTPEQDKRTIVTPTLTTTELQEIQSTMTPVNGSRDITTTEGLNADIRTTTVMVTEGVTDNGEERFDTSRTTPSVTKGPLETTTIVLIDPSTTRVPVELDSTTEVTDNGKERLDMDRTTSSSVVMKEVPLDTTTTEGSVLTSAPTRGPVESGLNLDSTTEGVTDIGKERFDIDRTTPSSVIMKEVPLDTTTTEGSISIGTTTRVVVAESTVAPSKDGVIVDSTTTTPSIMTSAGSMNTVFDTKSTTPELPRESLTAIDTEKDHPGSDGQKVGQEEAIVTKEQGFPSTHPSTSSQETSTTSSTSSTTTKAAIKQPVVNNDPEKDNHSVEEMEPQKRYEESGSPATVGCKSLLLSVVMALASLFIY